MQKFILDTNILLNGVFNPLSLSTKVICLLDCIEIANKMAAKATII